MAPRANWKGFLQIAEVRCPIALYTAASTNERIAFHTLNRKTGHRVRRIFLDSETEKPVEADDQVKGYEIEDGTYVVLEPEEILAAIPDSDKTLVVEAFVPCADIDEVYFDRPYYLAPSASSGSEAYRLILEGMQAKSVAALARTVLFRRMRTVLIRAEEGGLVANTLNFDYEVRSAKEAFSDIPDIKIDGEMLELAQHIIKTKKGKFDPKAFDDRYEAALTELVQAKLEGRKLERPAAPAPTKVVDLMAALRASAKGDETPKAKTKAKAKPRAAKAKKAA